jgi:hypothetical protein
MTQWEYQIADWPLDTEKVSVRVVNIQGHVENQFDAEHSKALLDGLGVYGWELVCVTAGSGGECYWFKRPHKDGDYEMFEIVPHRRSEKTQGTAAPSIQLSPK